MSAAGGDGPHQTDAATDFQQMLSGVNRHGRHVIGQDNGCFPYFTPQGKIAENILFIKEWIKGFGNKKLETLIPDGKG
jgi:hypothetical protein